MMTMGRGGDWTWMLPGKPVSAGDTWTVKRGVHLRTTLQMTMRYAHWCGADRADAARAVWRAIELVGQRG